MDMQDAIDILTDMRDRVSDEEVRAINIEVILMPDYSEKSAEIVEDLSATGVPVDAILIEDPAGDEYPGIIISGW